MPAAKRQPTSHAVLRRTVPSEMLAYGELRHYLLPKLNKDSSFPTATNSSEQKDSKGSSGQDFGIFRDQG